MTDLHAYPPPYLRGCGFAVCCSDRYKIVYQCVLVLIFLLPARLTPFNMLKIHGVCTCLLSSYLLPIFVLHC